MVSSKTKSGKTVFAITPAILPENMHNWVKVDQKINDKNLKNQHATTSTKLELARFHLRNMQSMIPCGKVTDLIPVVVNQDNSVTFSPPNLRKFLPFIASFEAFLFSLTSGIDSFLAETNLICGLQILSNDVCILKVKKEVLKRYSPNHKFSKHIISLYNESWFRYLGGLRNLIAHRSLSYVITTIDLKFYLPDNPDSDDISIKKDIELLPKLSELLDATQNYMDLGFGYLKDLL
jgi:hypothetical protein